MKLTRGTSFAIGVVATLVIGSGTAYAANGGNFLIGRSNSASATTTLSNSGGTALALNSKAGTPPLRVNRTTKVKSLNSDLLDGMDQTRFALAAGGVKAYDVPSVSYDLDEDGFFDTLIASATCPAGTRRTGGGAADFTAAAYLAVNAPDSGNSWVVVGFMDPSVPENPSDLVASVVCYSPRGIPAGGYRTTDQAASGAPSVETLELAKRALEAKRR